MKKVKKINYGKLINEIRTFTKDRDWDQFHSPKNLACALSVEVSELLELFQWMKEDESKKAMKSKKMNTAIKEEMADIFYYLLRLSDVLSIDLENALQKKMKKNRKKYPIKLSKGNSKKYSELKD